MFVVEVYKLSPQIGWYLISYQICTSEESYFQICNETIRLHKGDKYYQIVGKNLIVRD